MNKIKNTKSNMFFVQEYEDGFVIAFKNIADNVTYAEQIHDIVAKNNNINYFVSDLVKEVKGPNNIKNIINDSLFIYSNNNTYISAHNIQIHFNKKGIKVKYNSETFLIITKSNNNIFWIKFLCIFLIFICFIPRSVIEIKNRNKDTTDIHQNIHSDFVLIPSGTLFNSKDKDNKHYIDVDLDSFYICKHEVTQAEYEKIMKNNPSHIKGQTLPVNTIQFIDAIRYCNTLSLNEGYDGFYNIENDYIYIKPESNGYRLPNKHEWAYASRKDGHTKTKYAGGNNLKKIAWYGGNSNYTLHPVCTKEPNARGLYDMNGNVSELLWEKKYNEIGSNFCLYTLFDESDNVFSGICSEEIGFRVILITKNLKNSNIKDLKKIKHYINEVDSPVNFYKEQNRKQKEWEKECKQKKIKANKYLEKAQKAYLEFGKDEQNTRKAVEALENYKKALDIAEKYHVFTSDKIEESKQCIKILNDILNKI